MPLLHVVVFLVVLLPANVVESWSIWRPIGSLFDTHHTGSLSATSTSYVELGAKLDQFLRWGQGAIPRGWDEVKPIVEDVLADVKKKGDVTLDMLNRLLILVETSDFTDSHLAPFLQSIQGEFQTTRSEIIAFLDRVLTFGYTVALLVFGVYVGKLEVRTAVAYILVPSLLFIIYHNAVIGVQLGDLQEASNNQVKALKASVDLLSEKLETLAQSVQGAGAFSTAVDSLHPVMGGFLERLEIPIGLEAWLFPAKNVSASSSFPADQLRPSMARLNNRVGPSGVWAEADHEQNRQPTLQFDLGSLFTVSSIAYQGRDKNAVSQHVKTFMISYSNEEGVWRDYPETFSGSGNDKGAEISKFRLNQPVVANKLKVKMLTCNIRCSSRLEVYVLYDDLFVQSGARVIAHSMFLEKK